MERGGWLKKPYFLLSRDCLVNIYLQPYFKHHKRDWLCRHHCITCLEEWHKSDRNELLITSDAIKHCISPLLLLFLFKVSIFILNLL